MIYIIIINNADSNRCRRDHIERRDNMGALFEPRLMTDYQLKKRRSELRREYKIVFQRVGDARAKLYKMIGASGGSEVRSDPVRKAQADKDIRRHRAEVYDPAHKEAEALLKELRAIQKEIRRREGLFYS